MPCSPAAFYKLLDELWREADDLLDRGVTGTGQGFDAPSAGRLGAYSFIPTHNPPQDKMADAIRKVGVPAVELMNLLVLCIDAGMMVSCTVPLLKFPYVLHHQPADHHTLCWNHCSRLRKLVLRSRLSCQQDHRNWVVTAPSAT